MNAKNWRACVKDGVTKSPSRSMPPRSRSTRPTWSHGARHLAAPALFTAINKDTAELHHELVPFDADLAQRMSDRGVRILQATDAGELLPRIATSPTSSNAASAPGPSAAGAPTTRRTPDIPQTPGGATMSDDEPIIHFNPWRDFNDAAPQTDVFGDEPDPEQIAQFLEVVFGYCEGLIPVRGFVDKGQGIDGRPHNIWIEADATRAREDGDLRHWAWREGAAVYVIPGTVAAPARPAADVLQMQTVVVDLDAGDIAAKRAHLDPPPRRADAGRRERRRTPRAAQAAMSGGS
jgi:hypothetical protein